MQLDLKISNPIIISKEKKNAWHYTIHEIKACALPRELDKYITDNGNSGKMKR